MTNILLILAFVYCLWRAIDSWIDVQLGKANEDM